VAHLENPKGSRWGCLIPRVDLHGITQALWIYPRRTTKKARHGNRAELA